MLPVKVAIFNEIRKHDESYELLSDGELNEIMFRNPTGLRLSNIGFKALKQLFTVYSFAIPDDMKSKHKKAMSSFIYPYFITKNHLVLFSDVDAMAIKLCGSLEKFLETYS